MPAVSSQMAVSDSDNTQSGDEAITAIPKLTTRARNLLGEQLAAEIEFGNREIATALELLLEWYDRTHEASK